MRKPTAVLDLELTHPVPTPLDLQRYGDAQVLCRLHGRPLGFIRVPVVDGGLDIDILLRELLAKRAGDFAVPLAERALAGGREPGWPDISSLLSCSPAKPLAGPLVTVAVCTRDRADDVRRCLDALVALTYQPIDLLVVDNAPATDQTARLVRDGYPTVRYVHEPRPGLDWARNRAILECRGDILAFTDDDVIVDPHWITSLVHVFLADPEVMAVTGLVVPHELETDAQRLFEQYGGFGRGFARRWYRAPAGRALFPIHGGTGKFGTGANMAFWRRLFDEIGGFDPALDVGTCTNGGGDLDMFFRVLKAGHTLVYEPSAVVRHRHRRSYRELRTQITNNGVGFYSYLMRTAATFDDERRPAARVGAWWFRWWTLRRFVRSMLRKDTLPVDLVVAEGIGSLRGVSRYARARRRAAALAAQFAGEPVLKSHRLTGQRSGQRRLPEAIRHLDISRGLLPIADAADYERLRILVSWNGQPLGTIALEHHGAVVCTMWLVDAIAQQLTAEVLDVQTQIGAKTVWCNVIAEVARELTRLFAPARAAAREAAAVVAPSLSASVVVATYDRPVDLERCLASLVAQRTARRYDIVVVDNHPESGMTPPVVQAFSGVRLVRESRGGLSYARNAGIAAATGDIIVSTDDDVVVPERWLDRLLQPFRKADVMVTCGNVLPMELENDAQRMFEAYGGLGRGFERKNVDHEWFRGWRRSVPTWELGCTANAAFRASIFRRPDIGLMDEALGAGTPTGCSEDTYVFYRVLKAGYEVAYEPSAYVWHRHRNTEAALRRQIYSYSKGHVAYQLTTLLRDGDPRALVRIGYELPRIYARRAVEWLRGRSDYPMRLVALEIMGTLAGPLALWQSRRRVARLGGRAAIPATSDGARPDQDTTLREAA
jgi:GT2 family glycosyltransferase